MAEFFELGEKAVICKFQKTLRKAEYYENTHQRIKALCYKIKLKKMQCKYSLHIPLNCCRKGLKIMHTGSILINEKAAIGCNCVFHINTSVVAGKPNNSAPTIGNGVTVFVGAVLVGGIEIADHVVIGTNAVVNKSCYTENVTLAGAPAKCISNRGSKTWPENNF